MERRAIRIRGIVQGVGFRPAMYRLAESLDVTGFVRNDREGVWIEIEGAPLRLERFAAELRTAAPPASRIDTIEVTTLAPLHDTRFVIAHSPQGERGAQVAAVPPVDLGPCAECVRELDDRSNRRHRYPFINCTGCGPRFTIVREVPYDRANTTMEPFAMCADCLHEYATPSDRRFHAEPNACPACGPTLQLVTADAAVVTEGDAALRAAARAIADGQIVAVKGAGGFVLATDATSERAVSRLRERKRRPHKAFAVMVRSLADAERIAVLSDRDRATLATPSRPILLVPSRGANLARSIAPGLTDIGVYLPATPLQYLLLSDGPALQVMTSGNHAEEPIARTNEEAVARLADVADLFLVHDREVYARTDDTVLRSTSRCEIPMRRARGFVPDLIGVPLAGPPVLAVGGHERNTVCLAFGGQALMSQHIGDLGHLEAGEFFGEAVEHLQELAGVEADVVVHDLHPDYHSTRWAIASGLPRMAVQHHHAHVAACLVEHGRNDRVIGIAFDGTGLGSDGTLWGGEILSASLLESSRLGHLRPIALAGSEAAIREPWRIAAAALLDAGEPLDVLRVPRPDRDRIAALLATRLPVRASGAGRWFDAVAALLGAAPAISYDGQAAAQLEALAGAYDAAPFEISVTDGAPFEIDLRPAIRELMSELRRDAPRAVLAARFHATMAHAIRIACRRVEASTVVLTGGCFQNRRLLEQTIQLLEADRREVLTHRRVPPNDGGISLGQVAIATARLSMEVPPCA